MTGAVWKHTLPLSLFGFQPCFDVLYHQVNHVFPLPCSLCFEFPFQFFREPPQKQCSFFFGHLILHLGFFYPSMRYCIPAIFSIPAVSVVHFRFSINIHVLVLFNFFCRFFFHVALRFVVCFYPHLDYKITSVVYVVKAKITICKKKIK